MIAGIASLIFIPLLAVAMVHTLWAFGSKWPAGEEKALARTVVGAPNIERMPPRPLTFFVALAILCMGIWALAMSDPLPNNLLTAGGALIALIFLLRGGAAYTPQWRALTPEEPFASFDKKVYGPLCLWVGFGFAFLTIWRLL